MTAVIQRVLRCSVEVEGKTTGAIDKGLLVLLGVSREDAADQAEWLADKILALRIFPAEDGKSGFDRSVMAIGGGIVVVSQFTLLGDCRKGRRPNFTRAAGAEQAESLYHHFCNYLRAQYAEARVQTGIFGAKMLVSLINDGPVTLILDTTQA